MEKSGFLEENSGHKSLIRLVTLLWFSFLFLVWVLLSCLETHLVEIPSSVLELSGMLLAGKVIQKFGEIK